MRYKFYGDNSDRAKFLIGGGIFCLLDACFVPAVTLLSGDGLEGMEGMWGIVAMLGLFGLLFLISGIVMIKPHSKRYQTTSVDKGGFGWGLLGFLAPVIGLILYLIWKDSKPKTAKSIGKGALACGIVALAPIVFKLIAIILLMLFG